MASIIPCPDATFIYEGKRYTEGEFKEKLKSLDLKTASQFVDGLSVVPEMPFSKTWHELAMKKVLRHAAENGYDSVAWTTGEQQAERYDLSKQIDAVRWAKPFSKDEYVLEFVKDGKVEPSLSQRVPAAKIEEIVGKDLAEKIVKASEEEMQGEFRGDDLKVGGEGMKGFYDRILPSFMSKYGKKWGARTGTTEITSYNADAFGGRDLFVGVSGNSFWLVNGDGVKLGGPFKTEKQALDEMDKREAVPVHSIDITNAMKSSVMEEGQPLFKAEPLPPPRSRKGEAGFINIGAILIGKRTTPIPEVLTAMRRAGLLTGVRTHLRNLTSNTAFMVSEEFARPFMALADMAVSSRTGVRSVAAPSLTSVLRSVKEAGGKGIPNAIDIIRHGRPNPSTQQLDEIESGIPLLDVYVNGVFRTLEAEDTIFKAYAIRRSLEANARAQALTEKRTNPQLNTRQRAEYLTANPTARMQSEAIAYSEFATFQNKNLLSTKINELKEASPAFKFGFEQLIPFDKTPTNIVARVLEFSPVGLAQAAGKYRSGRRTAQGLGNQAQLVTNGFMSKADQKAFAETFGRGSLGTGIIVLGILLAAKGYLAGIVDYDDDKDEYFQRRAAGVLPGSFLIPGTNQRIVISGNPLGNVLTLGASMYEQWTRPAKTTDQTVSRVTRAALGPIREQPLVRAFDDYLVSNRPIGERAGAFVGSYIPTIVSDLGDVIDPKSRQAKGFAAQIRKRVPPVVPFNRMRLPESSSPVGGPDERGGFLRRAVRAVDPLQTTTGGAVLPSPARTKRTGRARR